MKPNRIFTFLFIGFLSTTYAFSQVQDTAMSKIYTMDMEELMNTTVTIATKSDKPINETPAVVSVITAEEIKNMGARELEDILQTVPGFELMRRTAGYYGIGVRGVKDSRTTSKILLMVDGNPLNSIFYGNSMGSGFNMDIVDRIEIIRGPGSALYGRNAFSGVINIITKSDKYNKKSFLKGTLGEYNTKILSGLYSFKKNRLNTTFSFKKTKTDNTDTKLDFGLGMLPWNIKQNNFTAGTNIDFGKFSLSATYFNLDGGGNFFDSHLIKKSGIYSISFKDNLSPKLSISTKIYGHNEKYVEDIESLPPNINPSYPEGIYLKPQFKEYLYGLEANINYKINSNNDFLLGFQSEFYGVNNVIITANIDSLLKIYPNRIPNVGRNNQVLYKPGWFENNKHSYQNLALFIQDIWYPVKKVGLTLGVRYDLDSQIGSVINPRAGVVFELTKNTFIKLLYGRAYHAPSPSEQYQTLGFVNGNKDLKPEYINTYELAISHQIKNFTNKISIFRNNLNNIIYAPTVTYINNDIVYNNLGENKSYGIEYETKLLIGKGLYTYLNYSFTKAENTTTINNKDSVYNQPDIAPHKLNVGINYTLLKYFKTNLNIFYRSEMEKLMVGNQKVQDNIGNFLVANFTLQVIDLINNLNLSTSIYNLMDTKYYSQDNERLNQPAQPGRQFIVSITYSF